MPISSSAVGRGAGGFILQYGIGGGGRTGGGGGRRGGSSRSVDNADILIGGCVGEREDVRWGWIGVVGLGVLVGESLASEW